MAMPSDRTLFFDYLRLPMYARRVVTGSPLLVIHV